MIWQFDKSKTSLFGSCHVLKDGANSYSKQIEYIYSQATHIVLEANLEEIDISVLTYNDGRKLRKNIPQKLYRKTKAKWLKSGFPVTELELTKPWQVANRLFMKLLENIGFTFEIGIDKQLFDQAKKDNKEIIFLEPANTSLNCFDKVPLHEQTKYLSMIVNDPVSVIKEFKTLLKAWSNSDINQLSIILQECLDKLPVLYQHLVIDRNKAWLNKITACIEAGTPTLIAVGALHCVGDMCSIQSLVRDIHGYSSNIIN